MTKSMVCELDFLTAKQVMLELLAERWLENRWGSQNAELGLQKCSFEASAWRTTNTELGLPTGPPGAGWAMYYLELLHFYLDETNAMRSTSVPEYLFLLSRRKSYSTGREGPCWTEWNFIKKTAGISFCNEIPAVFAHLLFWPAYSDMYHYRRT